MNVDISFVVGLLLAIPLSVVANMMTPRVQQWWAQTNEGRKRKRIVKLKTQLLKLEPAALSHSAIPAVTQGVEEPFLKRPRIEAAMGGSFAEVKGDDLKLHYIDFTNQEHRHPTTAHNLRASMTYIPFHGEPLKAKWSCWFGHIDSASAVSQKPSDSVSLGMLNKASLIVVVSRENDFYTPRYLLHEDRLEAPVAPEVPLEYGEWTLVINLDGDNFQGTFKYKMSLLPNGTTSWTKL